MADYIEREALIAKAKTLPLGRGELWTGGERPKFVNLADVVKAPAADVVERKRGEWYTAEAHNGYLYWNCNQCHGHFTSQRSNFCPNCGADMRPEGGADREL